MEGIEDVSKDCGASPDHHTEPLIERQDRDSLVPALTREFRKIPAWRSWMFAARPTAARTIAALRWAPDRTAPKVLGRLDCRARLARTSR